MVNTEKKHQPVNVKINIMKKIINVFHLVTDVLHVNLNTTVKNVKKTDLKYQIVNVPMDITMMENHPNVHHVMQDV